MYKSKVAEDHMYLDRRIILRYHKGKNPLDDGVPTRSRSFPTKIVPTLQGQCGKSWDRGISNERNEHVFTGISGVQRNASFCFSYATGPTTNTFTKERS